MRAAIVVFTAFFSIHLCANSLPAQMGDVTAVHDPSIILAGDTFHVFSTGRGIFERTSADLFHWKRVGRVFADTPGWTKDFSPGGSLWAPDISVINGEYWLYYAASSFGKTFSAIGLAVNKTLDRESADYRWVDRGKVISTPAGNNWNAIDPCAFTDVEGKQWMVLGSWWSGLKLIQVDSKTGLQLDPQQRPISVASRPGDHAIEEGYVRRHGDFYYLWVSADHCCRGVASDYRILIGRSKEVRGPYLDRDQRPMTEGGGTLVLGSYGMVRGPGSCAIVPFLGREFLIHHEYDGSNRGSPTLQVRPLLWAGDGWPVVGEPIQRSPAEKAIKPEAMTGDWLVRRDYGLVTTQTFKADGSIYPGESKWERDEKGLTMTTLLRSKKVVVNCLMSDEGRSFVGRMDDGTVITGVRPTDSTEKK